MTDCGQVFSTIRGLRRCQLGAGHSGGHDLVRPVDRGEDRGLPRVAIPVSPFATGKRPEWVRRALAATLPPKEL